MSLNDLVKYNRDRTTGIRDFVAPSYQYFYNVSDPGETGNYLIYFNRTDSHRRIADVKRSKRGVSSSLRESPLGVIQTNWDCSGLTPITGIWPTHTNGSYWRIQPNTLPPILTTDVEGIMPDVSDQDLFSLTREAFNYFADVFPAQMSFSEFIVGFAQFADLLPRLQDSIARSFTGGYLNWKFGWENLLSDLHTLGSLVDNVRSRLDYLRRTYGIPTRLGFSRRNLTSEIPIGTEHVFNWAPDARFSGGTWQTRITLKDYRIDFRAGAWILQTLDYIDGTIGLIRGLIGALGLNNPIKAVWVNIPFSFVVDWFFKISNHLDTLTRLQPATGWSIIGPTCSLSVYASFKVVCIHDGTGYGLPIDIRDNGMIAIRRYVRLPYIPLSLADLMPESSLSPNQLALFLALLHQQG